ncbi:hypothetical protein OTU49_012515 [Cherax quadricarinatus]|uniref:Mutator-like transposase domain-containing protein n=1 Tax=Cherax quadricarinatus TaxID=27406 RepID=A0AAW0VXM4_CHEQU
MPPREAAAGARDAMPPREAAAGASDAMPPREAAGGASDAMPPREAAAGARDAMPPREAAGGARELMDISGIESSGEERKKKRKRTSVDSPSLAITDVAGPSLATPDVASPSLATPDVVTRYCRARGSKKLKVDNSSVTIPSLATPDVASDSLATSRVARRGVATPRVATPDVDMSAVTISADASSAVPGTSTSDNATDINISGVDSVSDRNISSAIKRVSLLKKVTHKVSENFMVFMENTNFDLILSSVCCLKCFSNNIVFTFDHHHLETTVSAYCPECKNNVFVMKPRVHKDMNVATGRMVYAEMCTGGGYASFSRRTAMCNLPSLSFKTFSKYTALITDASVQSCKQIMAESREVIVREYGKLDIVPDPSGILDIDVTYDGTWHKRGHHSNLGIGVTIDAVTKLVIDYQIMCKFCFLCTFFECRLKSKKISEEQYEQWTENHKSVCCKNFTGSSGSMEAEAAILIWQRSLESNLRYKTVVCDGDSSTYKGLVELNNGAGPYRGVQVVKEECINHYSKRLKNRLTNLVKSHYNEKELKTGKKRKQFDLKKGMLTDFIIDKLAGYFQKNLRNHVDTDVVRMRNGILASFFHCSSSDTNPQHHLCPTGPNSWCFYQKAVAANITPPSHNTMKVHFQLDPAYFKEVHDIYKELTTDDMMTRCLKGRTQNPNESLHQRIWSYCNKALNRNKWQADFSASQAIAEYNAGYERSCLDIPLGFGRSLVTQRKLQAMDKRMQRKKPPKSKKRRLAMDTSYEPGGH